MIRKIRSFIKGEKGFTLIQGIVLAAIMIILTLVLRTGLAPAVGDFTDNVKGWVTDSAHAQP